MDMKKKLKNHMWGIHGGDEESFVRDGFISLGGKEDPISVERFIEKVRIGDTILLPMHRMVYIGKVIGECTQTTMSNDKVPVNYDLAKDINRDESTEIVFRRDVQWLGNFPRTAFSQGALFELGDTLKFVLIKNYMEEFKAAIADGYVLNIAEGGLDADAIDQAAFAVEDATLDYIEKKLRLTFSEEELMELEQTLRRITNASMDRAGFSRDYYAIPDTASKDGSEPSPLGELVVENYDVLDEVYKKAIPLRKIYVPVGR